MDSTEDDIRQLFKDNNLPVIEMDQIIKDEKELGHGNSKVYSGKIKDDGNKC